MKPICVPCQRFFRIAKTGFFFTEMMPKGNTARPGLKSPEQWQPYKVWIGDKWACPDCGAEIVVGIGHQPIAEHYQPEFALKSAVSSLNVNDC